MNLKNGSNLRLDLLGAADTVTGSRTLITGRGQRWLVDCGLFQGPKDIRDRNWSPVAWRPEEVDGVVLTHAHLDHSGYLPRLVKLGFRGPILCTPGTAELVRIILMDSAHLEEEQAAYANRTGYSNHKPAAPLFTKVDAEAALELLRLVPRDSWYEVGELGSFRFLRAGHIIGASLVQWSLPYEQRSHIMTFTGDLGNDRSLIMKSPVRLKETDTLVLESTYGNRLQPRNPIEDGFAKLINKVHDREGVLVIPAFAVGRAQEITYLIRKLEREGRIPTMPVILDSPMATAAMNVCLGHPEDQILDSAFLGRGDNFRPELFEVSVTPDDSMLACMRDGPMIVISASGMLSGGRILHHLKARLPDSRHMVLFCGYQADGTKGRVLQDGAADGTLNTLRIHHQEVPIEAEIATLDHLSAHADWQDILDWLEDLERPPELVILNHGHPTAQQALAERIEQKFGWQVMCGDDCRSYRFQDGRFRRCGT